MAIRFDASGDVLSRTTAIPVYNVFTWMAWVYVSANRGATGQMLFSLDAGSGSFYRQLYHNNLALKIWNGFSEFTGSSLVADRWYHIAFVSTNGLTCYLNGVADFASGSNISFSPSIIRMGNSDASEWFNGRMAAAKIYDAVLTQAEIQAEMKQMDPVRRANLNSYYRLLTTNDYLIDQSGQGRTLTAGGTLTTEFGPPGLVIKPRRDIWIPVASTGTSVTVTMTTNSAAFSTPSPSVLYDFTVALNPQTAAFSQPAVTVNYDYVVALNALSAAFSVISPSVDLSQVVSLNAQSATFTAVSPSVIYDFVVTLAAQTATFSQPALSVVTDQILTLGVQSASFTPVSPTVTGGATITAGVNTAAFGNPGVTVVTDAILAINPATATFTLVSPTVITGGDVTVDLAAQIAQFTQGTPDVNVDYTVLISPVTATFTVNSPTVVITVPSTATISRVTILLGIR